jgi:hypothetical protein
VAKSSRLCQRVAVPVSMRSLAILLSNTPARSYRAASAKSQDRYRSLLEPIARQASGAGAGSIRISPSYCRPVTACWVRLRATGSRLRDGALHVSRIPPIEGGPPPCCGLRPRNGPGATCSTTPLARAPEAPYAIHGHTRRVGDAGDKAAGHRHGPCYPMAHGLMRRRCLAALPSDFAGSSESMGAWRRAELFACHCHGTSLS